MKPPPNHTSRVLQVGVRGEAPKGGQPISMNRSPTSILETCTGTLPGSLCVKRPRGPWQLCLMDIHNGSSKGNRIGVTMGNPVEARVAVPAACSVGTEIHSSLTSLSHRPSQWVSMEIHLRTSAHFPIRRRPRCVSQGLPRVSQRVSQRISSQCLHGCHIQNSQLPTPPRLPQTQNSRNTRDACKRI